MSHIPRQTRLLISAVLLLAAPAAECRGVSAIFAPGRFTNHPETDEPMVQYARKAPAMKPVDPTYRRSGYVLHRYETRMSGGATTTSGVFEAWGDPFWYDPYGFGRGHYPPYCPPYYSPWGHRRWGPPGHRPDRSAPAPPVPGEWVR